MRIFALLFVCFMVALMSGLALFRSITSSSQGVWLDCLFILALILTLIFALSLVKRTATDSLVSSISDEKKKEERGSPAEGDD